MSKRIKITSPNGKSEMEIFESEWDRFKDQGFKKVSSKPSKKPTEVKSEVAGNGNIQG